VDQRCRQLPCGAAVIHVHGGRVEHGLQTIGAQRRLQWPPAADGHVGQHRHAVDPRTLRIQLAKPPAGLMKRQHAVDGHRRDERIVDESRHGYLLL
jgi:hypothetical protein